MVKEKNYAVILSKNIFQEAIFKQILRERQGQDC